MNVLLIIGLVLFACTIVWIYILFVTNAINDNKKTVVQEPTYDDAYERCQKLFEQGMHAELQRYAQRALQKNYTDIEIRRLLAQSLMAVGNEQMAIMHYEAITNISPGDIKTLELLAQYYYEHGPKPRTAELYEQILYYDRGNFNAVEQLVKLYEEFENFDRALELYQMLVDAEVDENVILELEYKMANIYLQIQDFSRAYEAYEKINILYRNCIFCRIILFSIWHCTDYLRWIWNVYGSSSRLHTAFICITVFPVFQLWNG